MMDTFFWQVPHCHHHPHHEIGWDPDFLLAFCNGLERWGLDGAHLSLDPEYPDPLAVAMALARATRKLIFSVEHRPDACSPTLFVQQVNTFALLNEGRIAVHFSEERKQADRLDEYLTICRAFWEGGAAVNFEGRHFRIEEGRVNTPFSSNVSARPLLSSQIVTKGVDIHFLAADTPSRLAGAARALPSGLRAGLTLTLDIDEAPQALNQPEFSLDESGDIHLCGSPRAVAAGITELATAGIRHFLFSGSRGQNTMSRFGNGVLPLLRGGAGETHA